MSKKFDYKMIHTHSISDKLNTIYSDTISSHSLSILLLSGSILFYHMCQQQSLKSPKLYTLSVSLLLILLSAIHSVFSTYSNHYKYTSLSQDNYSNSNSSEIIKYITIYDYYTLLIGLVFSMTILFICYLLIAYYKL